MFYLLFPVWFFHRLPWAMNHQLLLDFRNMQKIKMEDGKPGFLCGECQKCFPTKTAYRSHERYMHGSLQNELLNVLRQVKNLHVHCIAPSKRDG